MLVLNRCPGESIIIRGDIIVKVLNVKGNNVRIGIEAPSDIIIHREEVQRGIDQSSETSDE